MKALTLAPLVALGLLGAAAPASAYPISQNLSGNYVCVQNCRDGMIGGRVIITQSGDDVNIVNEAGESAQGWGDWNSPNRIWTEPWHQSAVYDGMTIQFDNGMVYRRALAPVGYVMRPVAPVPVQ